MGSAAKRAAVSLVDEYPVNPPTCLPFRVCAPLVTTPVASWFTVPVATWRRSGRACQGRVTAGRAVRPLLPRRTAS